MHFEPLERRSHRHLLQLPTHRGVFGRPYLRNRVRQTGTSVCRDPYSGWPRARDGRMNAPAVAFDALKSSNHFLDFETGAVPEHLRQKSAGVLVDWLASNDFALGHAFPPAQRVWIKLDEFGAVQHAY